MTVKYRINETMLHQARATLRVNAKYADSVLMGFYYKSKVSASTEGSPLDVTRLLVNNVGIQHPPWDFIADTLEDFNPSAAFIAAVLQTNSFEMAFEKVKKELKLAFEKTLSQAPVNTLNWWVRDYEPYLTVGID